MAIMVCRVSGVVSYSDGSVSQFAAHVDEHVRYSYNSLDDNWQSVVEVDSSSHLAARFEGVIDLVRACSVTAPGGVKTVTDLVCEFSGVVSNDDGSVDTFGAQYDGKGGLRLLAPAFSVPVSRSEFDHLFVILSGSGVHTV